jgi:hypothetical protein
MSFAQEKVRKGNRGARKGLNWASEQTCRQARGKGVGGEQDREESEERGKEDSEKRTDEIGKHGTAACLIGTYSNDLLFISWTGSDLISQLSADKFILTTIC